MPAAPGEGRPLKDMWSASSGFSISALNLASRSAVHDA